MRTSETTVYKVQLARLIPANSPIEAVRHFLETLESDDWFFHVTDTATGRVSSVNFNAKLEKLK